MFFSKNLISKLGVDTNDFIHKLDDMTMKTMEVEDVYSRDISLDVVLGYIYECSKHPDADKLNICQIDCGVRGKYQILTGATNIKADIYVPVALPGCYLSAIDLTISPRQMRGLDSHGMICSKSELGISEDQDKSWIWILDEDMPQGLDQSNLGKPMTDIYPYLSNTIREVKSIAIANRPDLTGHIGVAREIIAYE